LKKMTLPFVFVNFRPREHSISHFWDRGPSTLLRKIPGCHILGYPKRVPRDWLPWLGGGGGRGLVPLNLPCFSKSLTTVPRLTLKEATVASTVFLWCYPVPLVLLEFDWARSPLFFTFFTLDLPPSRGTPGLLFTPVATRVFTLEQFVPLFRADGSLYVHDTVLCAHLSGSMAFDIPSPLKITGLSNVSS